MTSRYDYPETHNPADDDYTPRPIPCGVCGADLTADEARARPYICDVCLDRAQARAVQHGEYRQFAETLARGMR